MKQLMLVGNSQALHQVKYSFRINPKAVFRVLSSTRIKIELGPDDWILVVLFQAHWRDWDRLQGFNFDVIQLHDSFHRTDEFENYVRALLK